MFCTLYFRAAGASLRNGPRHAWVRSIGYPWFVEAQIIARGRTQWALHPTKEFVGGCAIATSSKLCTPRRNGVMTAMMSDCLKSMTHICMNVWLMISRHVGKIIQIDRLWVAIGGCEWPVMNAEKRAVNEKWRATHDEWEMQNVSRMVGIKEYFMGGTWWKMNCDWRLVNHEERMLSDLSREARDEWWAVCDGQ